MPRHGARRHHRRASEHPAATCVWCWRRDAFYRREDATCRQCLRPRFPPLEQTDEWLEAVRAWRRHTGAEAADRAEAEADWEAFTGGAAPF